MKRVLFVLITFILCQVSSFSQEKYTSNEICKVLASFLSQRDTEVMDQIEVSPQNIVFEELIYKDQCLKREFGVYLFYLSNIDPPDYHLFIKNKEKYIIIEATTNEFLNYIFDFEKTPINGDILVNYIKYITKLKTIIRSEKDVTPNGDFIYSKSIVLGEY